MKDECVRCAQGFYKDVVGDGACTKCPDGRTTSSQGSPAASYCSKVSYCHLH